MSLFLLGVIVGLLIGIGYGVLTVLISVHKGIIKAIDDLENEVKEKNT